MSLVHLKNKNNGVTYVYESSGYWDKDKKQARSKRICIGKLDPVTGLLIPSKKNTLAEKEHETKKPGPVPSTEWKRKFYGTTYLFDSIAQKLGVTEDLKTCFPERHREILSVAYYLIMEDRNSLSRFPKWGRTHTHPFGKDISSQRSSELFGSIDEDSKQSFFAAQCKRRLETEYLFYDTTSISSYSMSLKQVRYGMNKDGERLPQINLALIMGESSGLPVYFRKLPGNVTDVKTLSHMLAGMDFLDIGHVKLVMDRGFYSEANINEMYRRHYKFLIAARKSLKRVREKLDGVRDGMITRAHYSSKHGIYYDSFLTEWEYSETKPRSGETIQSTKRLYLHLFYNDQRATDDKTAFNKMLDGLEEELTSGRRVPEHEKSYAKYYDIAETPVRGVKLTPKNAAISDTEKNYGYFALFSNGIKNPLEALEVYRSRDMIEKAFGNLKERLNLRRTSVSSEENLDGKMFVQFIALIILSYIRKAMHEHNLLGDYTIQEMLDELDVIEKFEMPGRKPLIGEVTKKQAQLFESMGAFLSLWYNSLGDLGYSCDCFRRVAFGLTA
ncbi:MAG: IS1634 family transposase [Synergistaceae bacterium]|jgi:transposase|nr:IS1634 family transposase [Synergistaceae bacterium]